MPYISIFLSVVLLVIVSLFVQAGLLYLTKKIFKLAKATYRQSLVMIAILMVVNLLLTSVILLVNNLWLGQIVSFMLAALVFAWLMRRYYLVTPVKAVLMYIVYFFLSLLLGLIIAVGVAISLANWYSPFVIEGDSMEKTYSTGDYVITDKLANDYNNGDVVIFKNGADKSIIKRIIASPGESLEIKDSSIYVNGVEVVYPEIQLPINRTISLQLDNNQYYVIGDNANHSGQDGVIEAEQITGEVVYELFNLEEGLG